MESRPLVRDLLRERQSDLTASERKLSAVLQEDSLVAGLQSITRLAEMAEVSTPTVIRLARKLGFDGFPDLQNAIREELAERIKRPLAKLDAALTDARDHIVSQFAETVSSNINRTLDRLDLAEFDAVGQLLSDPAMRIYLLGGRITRSNAHYFFNHLQIIRPNVHLLDSSPSVWPQSLLDMNETSVLVVFDIRRYERELEKLARLAVEQGARIVLFTDAWGSPIEKVAAHTFRSMVEVPSSWDSTLAINFLIEALVAEIQRLGPDQSAERIAALENMLGESRIFRNT
ncbi:MurR/RpiR family transcriptional regulator [Pseudooceanicola nitratireducens]|uniref:MurR/RpiR family transcriptional regulator n=1 Tax=Pseudooceanicola nitratireducens TaxID=517719 RepID=UPI001C96108C|nr:MurR/RpiR family transcriptional regulator [Pseudooceanicola nitratireducens]MBY6158937.1 MurR/RpiR family transcriptional regulator [Pseudooceanicola nitratireducens]MEC7297331.1 MurR/RpiR family transcriptional regulator [Pseudomonadota bacterium]MEC7794256.1 MurR/RpiR family transcriptional regulator [Pseudomonadota bacterium]MEC9104343.1 MurR/RpiR family transcriptional regulator [Pseudomonadota bacterium]